MAVDQSGYFDDSEFIEFLLEKTHELPDVQFSALIASAAAEETAAAAEKPAAAAEKPAAAAEPAAAAAAEPAAATEESVGDGPLAGQVDESSITELMARVKVDSRATVKAETPDTILIGDEVKAFVSLFLATFLSGRL